MKYFIISLISSLLSLFFIGCLSSKIIRDKKPISEKPTRSNIIDGIWQIDACYTTDKGIRRGMLNELYGFYKGTGLTVKDSNLIFDRKHNFVRFEQGNLNIYGLDTDPNCSVKGIYNISDSTKNVKYIYAPDAMESIFYITKFKKRFIKKHFDLNVHNANSLQCLSRKDYLAVFAAILYEVNTYSLEKDVLIFRNEKATGEIIAEIILKRLN